MNTLFLILFFVSLICIVVGLIKPSLFKFESRKKAGLIFGGSTILFFVLFGITTSPIPAMKTPTSDASTPVAQQAQNIVNNTEPAAQTKKTIVPEKSTPTPTPITSTSQAPKATSVPIQPTPQAPMPAPVSSETVSQKNAVKKAITYLNYTAFSHDGLVDQLEYDQFSYADAVYGADNSGADWNKQAVAKAKVYMGYSAFSHNGLIEQLQYDKFTQSQAEYGASAVGL